MRNLINQFKKYPILGTMFIAWIGGLLFMWIHIPVPWFLGPMAAVLAGSRFSPIPLYWPPNIRNLGMVVVGYSMGLSFTLHTLIHMVGQLPSIFLMTVILILSSSLISLLVSRVSGIDYPTILTGSIPGGLSQMLLLAEETNGIDLTVVTFLQVTRQMMVIILVPLYIFNPLFGVKYTAVANQDFHRLTQWGGTNPNILFFAAVCLICAVIGKKIKMPTAFLVGPIIGTAILNISGIHGSPLPVFILNSSQLMIGTYVGLLLKPETLTNKRKIMLLAVISGSCLLLISFGLSLLLKLFYGSSYPTSYLCIAPGGMDQMGILAHEINANLSMVVGYQLFRLFFICFAVPPILKLVSKCFVKQSSILLQK